MTRVIQALLFDKVAFDGFEKNAEAIVTSGIIVFFSGVSSGIGAIFAPLKTPHTLHSIVIIFLTISFAFITWFSWAGLSYLLGTKILGGQAKYWDIARNLGFAYVPTLLMVLLVLPVGLYVITLLLVWMAGIGAVAVLSAEKFGLLKALVTTTFCWLTGIVVMANLLISLRFIPSAE